MQAPEHVLGLIVQNANAHRTGLGPQWDETQAPYWSQPSRKTRRPRLHTSRSKGRAVLLLAVAWVRLADPAWYPLGGVEPLVYTFAAGMAFLVAVLAGIPSARRAAAVQPMMAMCASRVSVRRRVAVSTN